MIVGGGAAGNAAAEMLRREGYSGRITMLSADASVPCDRPNLSKGYLAGHRARGMDSASIAGVLQGARHRPEAGRPRCRDRHGEPAGAARGRQPARLRCAAARHGRRAGAARCARREIFRTCTICARSPTAARWSPGARLSKRAVVIGASFIGLEVAASLRARNIDVHVVAPETVPMEKILGAEVGTFHPQAP